MKKRGPRRKRYSNKSRAKPRLTWAVLLLTLLIALLELLTILYKLVGKMTGRNIGNPLS